MDWTLRDDRPIWIQLTEQLTARIAAGIYPSGSKLPTVRELAAQAGVNPNTAQRALAQLEQDGLVITERGAGRTITDNADSIERVRRNLAQGIASDFFCGMQGIGYDRAAAINYIIEEESPHE